MADNQEQVEEVEAIPTVDRKENFIPFRLKDLKNRLVATFEDHFDEESKQQFSKFVERLCIFTRLRLMDEMEAILNAYSWVDPDVDVSLPKQLAEDEMEKRCVDFIDNKIVPVLEDAGFLDVPGDEIAEAQNSKNADGIEVTPPELHQIYYKMYQRGRVKIEKTVSSWRTLWRKKKFIETEYKRLFVVFSLNDDNPEVELIRQQEQEKNVKIIMSTEEVKPDEQPVEVIKHPWWQFWNWCSGPKEVKIKGVKPDMVYMKIFKDLQVGDIDQLVPGSRIKFSLMDQLMIWVPVVFGFGAAIYKAARGSLNFEPWLPLLTTLFLVLFPLYYGYRAYAAIKQKAFDLKARLNELFLMKSLTNNSGVLSYLIEEAEEQEDKEALMAYFFLWKNYDKPMSKEDLDMAVEEFLVGVMQKFGVIMRFDFDVADALGDCVNMGIVKEVSTNMYTAVNFHEALEKVALKNFPQK
eukprot:TRINITY_DN4358_c0_g1_i2.p2 TRINITY_DN4358_c0_g1~~TRINITY_DN4358_c0_g1_i2.p2  ORF type:complete len:465 (-),score=70.04 TRINITY_DN4358_c0_g1_i2:583-1977(-)